MLADLRRIDARWFYRWKPTLRPHDDGFVPMIWSGHDVAAAGASPAPVLLTFNEPDRPDQANMPVDRALAHWPALMASGKRLGSPAVASGNDLGATSWLGRFMAEADRRGYRVDFIAVHYYARTPDVAAFKARLTAIHEAYGRPIWVTEWALADWKNPGRVTPDQQAGFVSAAAEMLDDLPFVERHAWFGLYEGLDGWKLGSGLFTPKRDVTAVGRAFAALAGCR